MPDIFLYTDYRKFLADYYNEKKATKPSYSYRMFAEKAGFKSKEFLFRVIQGERNLSRSSTAKLCEALGFSARESRYFELLSACNQAGTVEERDFYYRQLAEIRKAGERRSRIQNLDSSHMPLFSDWHSVALRSLVDTGDYKENDAAKLGKMLYPRISAPEVRRSLKKLVNLGFLETDTRGHYRLTSQSLTTDPEVASISLARFHLSCLNLAASAARKLPRSRRNISGVTMAISQKSYREIEEAIQEFRRKVATIADNDSEADGVYQMEIALFPFTDTEPGGDA